MCTVEHLTSPHSCQRTMLQQHSLFALLIHYWVLVGFRLARIYLGYEFDSEIEHQFHSLSSKGCWLEKFCDLSRLARC